MEDYPRDLLEFESRFATEEACRDYLFAPALAGRIPLSELRA